MAVKIVKRTFHFMFPAELTPTCDTALGPRAAELSWLRSWSGRVAVNPYGGLGYCWPSGWTEWSESPDWPKTPWRTDGSQTSGYWPTPQSEKNTQTHRIDILQMDQSKNQGRSCCRKSVDHWCLQTDQSLKRKLFDIEMRTMRYK